LPALLAVNLWLVGLIVPLWLALVSGQPPSQVGQQRWRRAVV
jgi:hypothetical protein